MKKFIMELFSNPDGTGSTKRTAGWLLILFSILIGSVGVFTHYVNTDVFSIVFLSFLTGGLSAFGLSSFDTKTYFNNIGTNIKNIIPNIPDNNDPMIPPPPNGVQ